MLFCDLRRGFQLRYPVSKCHDDVVFAFCLLLPDLTIPFQAFYLRFE
jgi:hypothetical protein